MSEEFLDFTWTVAADGYEWRMMYATAMRFTRGRFVMGSGFRSDEGRVEDGALAPILVPRNPSAEYLDPLALNDLTQPLAVLSSHDKQLSPLLENPALFREFGSLDGTMESMRLFANTWGPLGSDCQVQFLVAPHDRIPQWGEVAGRWSDELMEIKLAIHVADRLQSENEEFVSKGITWDGDSVGWSHRLELEFPEGAAFVGDEEWFTWMQRELAAGNDRVPLASGLDIGGTYIADEHWHPERLSQLADRNPWDAMRFLLSDLVNEGTLGRVDARLAPTPDERDVSVRLFPDSLIGAMWLQLALAIDKNASYRKCVSCEKWFEISPGSGRPEKIYCSNACRMREYRKNRGNKK